MHDLLVRRDRRQLSLTFYLTAFITDWETAGRNFVAAVAERFRESLNPRPGDFSASSVTELGEAWCKYRIFGGPNHLALRADSMTLHFANIINAGHDQIVLDLVQGTMDHLLPALESYARQSYAVFLNYHVDILGGRADEYLARHGSDRIGHAASKEVTAEYRPVIGCTFRTRDGCRVFRRAIEQSESLRNGLFIVDQAFVSIPTLTEFDEELSWLTQTTELADRSAGIAYEKDEVDDGVRA